MIPIIVSDDKVPPKVGQYRSTVVLHVDNWDDYHYRTSFGMSWCDSKGKVTSIGAVKIYFWENDEARTRQYSVHTKEVLGTNIEYLGSKFCSLGQELSYYKILKALFPMDYVEILKRLNDIAVFEEIREHFIHEKGVQSSLLRFSGAQKALNEAAGMLLIRRIEQSDISKDISFEYRLTVPYNRIPTTLRFDFTKNEDLPYRINVLIGKNGTGKTQILSKLANSLSGYTDDLEVGSFCGERPPVDKVMSISYRVYFVKEGFTPSQNTHDCGSFVAK